MSAFEICRRLNKPCSLFRCSSSFAKDAVSHF
jgi:hypothetical protein